MKKLKLFFKEFFTAFPLTKSIVLLSFTYGLFVALEVLSYFILFQWNETLIGEAPRNYFTVITVGVAYGAFLLVPQIIFEMYRARRLRQLLQTERIPYRKIIKRYSIAFPHYNEFKIIDKGISDRNSIQFMTAWIYIGGFLYGFFVLLRVSEVDDIIAVPALALTAVMWGVWLSLLIRLIGNFVVRKVFWGKVDLTHLNKEDTLLMEDAEISSDKKTIFRMRIFIVAQTLIMLFVMLALYFVISFAGLLIGSGCSIVVAIAVILYSSLKKYEKEEQEDKFTYTFKE